MVEQLVTSPPAFCTCTSTASPNSASRASTKPWVAASRAGCWASWQTPTVKVSPSGLLPEPLPEAAGVPLSPQAARDRVIAALSARASNFFFMFMISFSQ